MPNQQEVAFLKVVTFLFCVYINFFQIVSTSITLAVLMYEASCMGYTPLPCEIHSL